MNSSYNPAAFGKALRVQSFFQRSLLRIAFVLAALLWAGWTALAQEQPQTIFDAFAKIVYDMEIKAQGAPPDWYDPGAAPLWRFVQITDIHYYDALKPILIEALHFVDTEIKPVFVAITGDNSGNSAVERQQLLKSILDENLKTPYYIIRGDNWPRNFSKVFGSTRYAFECGGIRFVFTGLDRDAEGHGIGYFADDTWQWMMRELRPETQMPVLLLMHENIQPPVFADAGRLDRLLESSPCVAGTLTGHLHPDVEFRLGRVMHICAPTFGRDARHPFKVYEVHRRHIAARSVERVEGRFRFVEKYQRIDLPFPASVAGEARVENYRALPPRETSFDLRVEEAMPTVMAQMAVFAQRAGMFKKYLEVMSAARRKAEEAEPAGR